MNRRDGVTLIESLVALFVAALGMIALLTLFPLGALQMGQALKDSRCGHSAQEADGLLRWYWEKYETDPSASTPIMSAMDRGDGLASLQQQSPPDSGRQSYPVLVDPLGKVTTWTFNNRVAGMQSFPRQTTQNLAAATNGDKSILRFCMLQDDITYSPARTGAPASGVNVERGGRYTWAWLLQRPDKNYRGLVNMSVIVYDQRAPFYATASTEMTLPKNLADNVMPQTADPYDLPVNFTPGSTSLVVNYTGVKPAILKGRWLMDATGNADFNPLTPLRHANFYRVVSVNAEENANSLFVELETPIRRTGDFSTNPYAGRLVVLAGVAEVFERPQLITGDLP